MVALRRNSTALVALLLFGCAGRSTTTATAPDVPDAGPLDLAHFSEGVAAAFCGALRGCCDAKAIAYNDAACTSEITGLFEKVAGPARANGRIAFDAISAAACLDELKAREARCANDDFDAPAGKSACAAVFKGTVAPGGACVSDAECAPDPAVKSVALCQSVSPEAHACTLYREALSVGEACTQSGATLNGCKNGLSCVASPTRTCPAFAAPGAACADAEPCDPAVAYCDGTCKGLPKVGEACGRAGACAPGLYCKGAACASSNAPTGDTCVGGLNDCPQGQRCANASCVVSASAISTASPSHLYDVTRRSCTLGPLAEALDDGGLVSSP